MSGDDRPPIPPSLLNTLNQEQREAVLHGRGPALILAGAGSGKTRVLTNRIAGLISVGARPHEILALTFTNKAAREMRARVEKLLAESPEVVRGVTLQTFHAFGASYLRQYATELGRTEQFVIYDSDDQLKLIKEVLNRRNIELNRHELIDLREAFNTAKQLGEDADEAYCPPLATRLDLKRLGRAYETALETADAFDFGDLIQKPLRLLQDPRRRGLARDRYPWILVDEFQDTNRAQLMLLQALCPSGGDLFVVGDDDQSIYAWRGAEVTNILRFESHYPSARIYKLQQNYRSKGNILSAANGVIKLNADRMGKQLWTEQEEGSKITVYHAQTNRSEAHFVATEIKKMVDAGQARYSEIAILYRANSLTLDLEDALMKAALPYVIVRGRNFFERAIIRDAVAHLRLLINPRDLIAFQRAILSSVDGVGKVSLERIAALGMSEQLHLFEASLLAVERGIVKGKAKRGILRFCRVYMEGSYLEQATLADQGATLLQEAGIYTPERLGDMIDETRRAEIENISRLIDTISDFEERSDEPSWFAYLEQIRLISDADTPHVEGGQGAVSLMTVHASKGLEFPVVFVIGLEEELFPSGQRGGAAGLEEERRLFYVAVTRAERRLILSYAQQRALHGRVESRAMSRFLQEVDPRLVIDLREGGLRTWAQRRSNPNSAIETSSWADSSGESQSSHGSRPYSSTPPSAKTMPPPTPARTQEGSQSTQTRPNLQSHGDFAVGVEVRHKTHGIGWIKAIERRGAREVARVQFGERERVILIDFLTRVEET